MIKVRKLEKIPYCQLGEGLFWDSNYSKLWFVDIKNYMLFRYNLNNGTLDNWHFGEEVCWVLPTKEENSVLLGCATGILTFNLDNPKERNWLIDSFPKKMDHRLNDVGIDSLGRIWFGSMHRLNESLPVGELVSYSGDEGIIVHDSGYKITNGPIISKDAKYLYHNDSAERIMYRYTLNLAEGMLSERIIFRQFNEEEGLPDGMCFDAQGNILVAMWGSGLVHHIDTNAKTLNLYKLPVPNITNVCFGGDEMDKLFVTTARTGLETSDLQLFPESGAVFEVSGLMHHGALSS